MRPRAIVNHQGTAIALLLLPNDKILFIRQWRPAVGRWTIEAPGGLIDKPESARLAVIREIREELGIEISEVRSLGSLLASVGYSDEIVYAFAATLRELPSIAPEDGVSPVVMTALDFCRQDGPLDAKTLAALKLLELTA